MATFTKTKDYVVTDEDFNFDNTFVCKSGNGDCLDLKSGNYNVTGYHVVVEADKELGGDYVDNDSVNVGDLVLTLDGDKFIALKDYYKMNGKHSFQWIKNNTYDVNDEAGATNPVNKLISIIEDGHVDFTNAYVRDEFYANGTKVSGTAFNDEFDLSGAVLYDKKTGQAIDDNSVKGFTIDAGQGNDAVVGSMYSDTITAGTGNGNTIAWDLNDGNFGDDVINLTKGEDTEVTVKYGNTALLEGAVKYEIVGNDVKASVYDAYTIGYTKTGVTVSNVAEGAGEHEGQYRVSTVVYKALTFNEDGSVATWNAGSTPEITYQATAGDNNEKITAFSKIGTRVDGSEVVMATTPNPTAFPTAKDNGTIFVNDEKFGTMTFKNLAKSDVVNYGNGIESLTSGSVTFNGDDLSSYVYNVTLDKDNTKYAGTYLNENVVAKEKTTENLTVNVGGSVGWVNENVVNLSESSGTNTISAANGSMNDVTGGSGVDKLKMGSSTTTFNLDLTKLNGDDVVTLSKDEEMTLKFKNDIVADQVKAEIVGKDVVVTTYKEVGEHGAAKEDVALGTVGGALYKETAGTYVVSEDGNDLYKDGAYTGKVSELAEGAQLRIKNGDNHDVVANNDKAVYKVGVQWTGKASEFTGTQYTDGNAADAHLKNNSGNDAIKTVYTLDTPTELALNSDTTDTTYEAPDANTYASKEITRLYDGTGAAITLKASELADAGYNGSEGHKLYTDAEHTQEIAAGDYAVLATKYGRWKFNSTNEGNINVDSNYTKVEEEGVVTFTKQDAQTVYAVEEQALDAAVAADTFFVTGGVLVARGEAGEFFQTVQYTGKASALNAATDYVYEHINDGAKLTADEINAHKRYTLDKLVDTSEAGTSTVTFTGLAGKDIVGIDGLVIMTSEHHTIGSDLINTYNYEYTLSSSEKKFTGTYLNEDIDASGFEVLEKDKSVSTDWTKKGVTIDAKDGANAIIGSNYSDTIKAGKGDDFVIASTGNDVYSLGSNNALANNSIDYSELIESNTEFGNDVVNLNKKDYSDLSLNLTKTAYDEQVKYAKDGNNIVVRVMKMADTINEAARNYDEDLYLYNDGRFELAGEDVKIYKDVAYTGKAGEEEHLYKTNHTALTDDEKTEARVWKVANAKFEGTATTLAAAADKVAAGTAAGADVIDAEDVTTVYTVTATEIALDKDGYTSDAVTAADRTAYTAVTTATKYYFVDTEDNNTKKQYTGKMSDALNAGKDGWITQLYSDADCTAALDANQGKAAIRYSVATVEGNIDVATNFSYNSGTDTYSKEDAQTVYVLTEYAVNTATEGTFYENATTNKLTARTAVSEFLTAELYTGKVADIKDEDTIRGYNYIIKDHEEIDEVYDESTMIAKDDKGNYVELGTITLNGLGKDNEIANVTIIDEDLELTGTSIFKRDMAILASKGGTVDGTFADDAIIVGGKTATITGNFGDDEIISTADTNTFNMGKNFGDDKVLVSDTSKNTFAFADSAVDSMVFTEGTTNYDLIIDTPDGSVSVKNLDLSKATLTDSTKGKYSFNALTEDTELSKTAKGNSVSFVEVDDDADKGLTVKDSKYNDAVIGSALADTFYYTQGGRDLFQGNAGADLYKAEKMDAKTALTISDSSNGNILSFTASNIEDIGLLFNVNRVGGTLNDGSDVWFYDRNSTTTKSVMSGLAKGSIDGAVRVTDVNLASSTFTADFGAVIDKDGTATKNVDVNNWVLEVQGKVAGWLAVHTNFSDAMDVFNNGTQADVNSLMNQYNTAVADYYNPQA